MANKIFKAKDVDLELLIVPPLQYSKWERNYRTVLNPPPEAPFKRFTFHGKERIERVDDEQYKKEYNQWELDFFYAQIDFFIDYVKNDPPVDYVIPDIIQEQLDDMKQRGKRVNQEKERKRQWVYEVIDEADLLTDFVTAMAGQDSPVEKEIQEEVANFPDNSGQQAD